MDTTPTPEECGAEPRNRPGLLTFFSGHKLHATVLAGALILAAGTTAAVASTPSPIWATSVSSPALEAPVDSEHAAPEVTENAAVEAAAAVAPEAAAPAPAPEPEPTPEPVVESAPPAPPADPALTNNAYTIVAGDSISAVAARYGVDREAMLAANGLTIYSTIVPGLVVKFTGPAIAVPQAAAAPAAAQAPAPAWAAQRPAAATPAPAPAPAPAATPAGRMIYLSGSGGQAAIDRCAGPVHFTPVTESMNIAEHDFCGGWARFSGIQVGETVTIAGVGTYTAYGRGTVPQGGTTDNVRAVLGGMPPVFLQTCIPGTKQMLVIGLR